MIKFNKILLGVLLSILIVVFIIPVSFGNSAEPPSVLIIVPNAPEDLEISIWSEGDYIKANESDKMVEKYYTFYSRELNNLSDYRLKVSTGDSAFEIRLNEPLKSYNNIFTLDLKKETLVSGKLLSRTITLVSMRIILTLIIEGFVFLLFGYRQKRSWIIFFIINLITQGVLNIWINGFMPLMSYIIFALIFAEIWIFVAEMISFSILIKEQSRLKTILYVLTANLLSLIAGGYVISVLPI